MGTQSHKASAPEEIITITDEMLAALVKEKARSRVGAMALLRGKKDKPAGLSAAHIEAWLNGSSKSTQRRYFDYVLAEWQKIHEIVDLTESVLSEILYHKERTGVGAIALLRLDQEKPDKLLPPILQTWMSGICKTARKDHVEYVLQKYKSLPDKKKKPF